MKVLIYGGKGWIGTQFARMFEENRVPYILGRARPQDASCLEVEVHKVNPTHVLCTIGRTHGTVDDKDYPTIDYLEQPGKLIENLCDNLHAPIALATLCERLNIHLTRLGTGCIFKYDATHPVGNSETGFKETDKPNFSGSQYSSVMGVTDQLMGGFKDVLNLRVRMPVGAEANPRDFITKITAYEEICSVPNSITVLPNILPIVLDMMRCKKVGTYNATSPGVIAHDEILEMYRTLVDKDFVWKNFSALDQAKILASERSNNCLDTTKLESEYPHVLGVREALHLCLTNR